MFNSSVIKIRCNNIYLIQFEFQFCPKILISRLQKHIKWNYIHNEKSTNQIELIAVSICEIIIKLLEDILGITNVQLLW